MNIRPVSDLRNRYTEIEQDLATSNAIFLTKNGYGTAVIMSIEEYTRLSGNTTVPPRKHNKNLKSARGLLHEYAKPDLIGNEKEGIRNHIMKKYSNGGNE